MRGYFGAKMDLKKLTDGGGVVIDGVGAVGVTLTVELQGPLPEQVRVAGVHSEGSVEGAWPADNG
jgi:hypothetical protein